MPQPLRMRLASLAGALKPRAVTSASVRLEGVGRSLGLLRAGPCSCSRRPPLPPVLREWLAGSSPGPAAAGSLQRRPGPCARTGQAAAVGQGEGSAWAGTTEPGVRRWRRGYAPPVGHCVSLSTRFGCSATRHRFGGGAPSRRLEPCSSRLWLIAELDSGSIPATWRPRTEPILDLCVSAEIGGLPPISQALRGLICVGSWALLRMTSSPSICAA